MIDYVSFIWTIQTIGLYIGVDVTLRNCSLNCWR